MSKDKPRPVGREKNEDYFTPAIAWRSETYYRWAMGGSSINGIPFGNVGKAVDDTLRKRQINQFATFLVSSKTLDAKRTKAEITVTVTALNDLPPGIRLHAAVIETDLDVVAVYGKPTGNGQRHVYGIVRELLTDSAGVPIAALAANKSHGITKPFERDPAIHNADSLRVVAWLQIEATKTIIAAAQTAESAIPAMASVAAGSDFVTRPNLAIRQSGGNISFVLPFDGANGTILTMAGRNLGRFAVNGNKGDRVSVAIAVPRSGSVVVLKLFSANGREAIAKVVLK